MSHTASQHKIKEQQKHSMIMRAIKDYGCIYPVSKRPDFYVHGDYTGLFHGFQYEECTKKLYFHFNNEKGNTITIFESLEA